MNHRMHSSQFFSGHQLIFSPAERNVLTAHQAPPVDARNHEHVFLLPRDQSRLVSPHNRAPPDHWAETATCVSVSHAAPLPESAGIEIVDDGRRRGPLGFCSVDS